VGLANCIEGFSTFAARPLVNVHDLVVLDGHRGRRIGQRLLQAAEQEARRRDACKLTLEVLTGNAPALRLYERFGFEPYVLDPALGQASFMHKPLAPA
jgi:ribosomal protein S18 acetylase RimI-like enzyme